MIDDNARGLHGAVLARFSDGFTDAGEHADLPDTCDLITSMVGRGSCRSFLDRAIPPAVLDMICAAALASPTKSDLQQRDIVLLASPDTRRALAALVPGQDWVAQAPMLVVFCGNNRRQRLLHDWRGVPFANDHLDAFFNAVGDAAIALGAFVTAAEALGLGCCPISAVRNEAQAVSDLLALPDHVFPFAGLALGYPRGPAKITKRLPLGVTCHVDRYREDNVQAAVQAYDRDRERTQPYTAQRFADTFGTADAYGWSMDKARQYSQPERADFGAFVRRKGFRLD
ncbi:MAG: nitroreductase family protein [Pseudomonadota bacterium]